MLVIGCRRICSLAPQWRAVQMPKEDAARVAIQFGKRVHRARSALGISQEQLADVAGFHRTYIGHLERGEVNPSLYNVVRLAAALCVDPAELVTKLRPARDRRRSRGERQA